MKALFFAFLLFGQLNHCLADVELSILVEDLGNVSCFSEGLDSPVLASALVREMESGSEITLPVSIAGPFGIPASWEFVIQGDDWVVGTVSILDFRVDFVGPEFCYRFNESWDPLEFFYAYGPALDPAFSEPVPAADGCGSCDPGAFRSWNRELFPDGLISLSENVTIPVNETLAISAGMHISAEAGVQIVLHGDLLAQGTAEDWITFDGDHWGGIYCDSTASGLATFTEVRDADSDNDGGALYLAPGAELALENCLFWDNHCTQRGGAVFVSSGAQLRLRATTVSHNGATGGGGNIYLEATGLCTGYYNLVTFGEPQSMIAETGNLFGNLQSSLVYPLDDPDLGTGWYCDPGYVNSDLGDFRISYWNPLDNGAVNCTIDVSLNTEHLDPDGTTKDMGAFPFNQFDILLPPAINTVVDYGGDQGGVVEIEFQASPNDGSWINPVTFYNLWVRYPDSDDYVNSGQFIGAMGQEYYTTSFLTAADSLPGNPNVHTFRISAHNSMNPQLVALSDEGSGWSVDNISPLPITGLASSSNWSEEDTGYFSLEVSWEPSQEVDFNHYELLVSDTGALETAVVLSESGESAFNHRVAVEELQSEYTYFVYALDHTGNRSSMRSVTSPHILYSSSAQPLAFHLGVNSPNPFNPTTTIDWDLGAPARVKLVVYNMAGALVGILVDSRQAAGKHQIVFDGSNLASGVYIYRIDAGNHSASHKMLLLK